MAISATTQGIRPGVATSTNRPAVPFDGQVISETDTDTLQIYKGSAWGSASALQLIKTQTIGTAVSSVTVSDAFSSAYDNYKITVNGGVGSTNENLSIILGATTTGYYYGLSGRNYAGSANGAEGANAASFLLAGNFDTGSLNLSCELMQPNLTKKTFLIGNYVGVSTGASANFFAGFLNNSTSYTAFTITAASGNLTGGTIRVYGYANS